MKCVDNIIVFNKKVYPDIALNIVSVHGVYSKGDDLATLCDQIAGVSDFPVQKVKVSVINYGFLLLFLERVPFVRNLIAMVIANRLATCSYKYPNAKTIVVSHSFGTWAVCESLHKWGKEFRINVLILFGSVVSRKFRFDRFERLEVYNFIGKRDIVVFLSALWGTGWSGIFGFKKDYKFWNNNVAQIKTKWGHRGYTKSFSQLYTIISNFCNRNNICH